MSVRERYWTNAKGEQKKAWVVDYFDQRGKRHIKTFARKKAAELFRGKVTLEVREGRHTADSDSITVAQAGRHWLANAEANGLERATIVEYARLLDMHISPYLGSVKLSKLTAPMVSEFRNRLRNGMSEQDDSDRRSPVMVRRIITALSSILADAQEDGHVSQNVARSITSRKKKKAKAAQKRKLRVGVDIPSPAEVKAIVGELEKEAGDPRDRWRRWRPLLLTALFTGLRASELRGLRWEDVDLARGEIHVRQRADRFDSIGAPKSEAGERTVPLTPKVAKALREWKAACPKGRLGLAFPNGAGRVENLANIVARGLLPVQMAAGVCVVDKDDDNRVVLDDKGEPARKAKYTGLHSLRHFFASWCVNRKADGGLELPGKVAQEWLGHSAITMTMDTYGHLFPRGKDTAAALAEAEQVMFGQG